MNINMLRTRWAAIGAAVAISLGAGGLSLVNAATAPAGASTYVAITPCRLLDTRPAPDTVGAVNTPIVGGTPLTVLARGENGNCRAATGNAIPATATGLQLNVTGVGASSATFVTVWPAGATQPVTSNLNLVPGAPPTPNAVTTGLSADGRFSIANGIGSTNIIVDIVGYYTDHTHTGQITGDSGKMAYAWSCDPSRTIGEVYDVSASSACGYAFNATGNVTVTRTAVGLYTVAFPGLALSEGHYQVTAYGSSSAMCKIGSWGASTAFVRCFDPAGALVDATFTILALD